VPVTDIKEVIKIALISESEEEAVLDVNSSVDILSAESV
jgi:hypothetical protein